MQISKVYFHPINSHETDTQIIAEISKKLLQKLISENNITLPKKLPIKVHTGQPGNITFIKPENFTGMINLLKETGSEPYYTETNMPGGPRSSEKGSTKVAKEHGFTQIPFLVADGDGYDHTLVPISGGKHFTECKIGSKLADSQRVLVISHFKGHSMAGFGGTIKQLGIGFASARGKVEAHAKVAIPEGEGIDWGRAMIGEGWNEDYVWAGKDFMERTAEYALAAVNSKQYFYIQYAINITPDCDCDGSPMQPVYKDVGIFASLDPVAIDKASFDVLAKREGKKPFEGDYICEYGEKISLGAQDYELVEID